MIVDCHVNVWEDRHCTETFRAQTKFARPGSVGIKADADTLHAAMAHVDKAIIFSLRYGDSAGVDGDDEVPAAPPNVPLTTVPNVSGLPANGSMGTLPCGRTWKR